MRCRGMISPPDPAHPELALTSDPRALLRGLFDIAIGAVLPGPAVLRHLPPPPKGRCVVVGAGKAAAAMAAAVDAAWPDVDLSGVVTTRYGHAVPAGRVEVIEAGHPVPDAASEEGARRVLRAVAGLGPDDLVLALISGGGSATLALPMESMTLADKQQVTRALLRSGAAIGEMNIVRKHLSRIKGGRLAAAVGPARLVTLAISDVAGDDPAAIASGPTVADASSAADALAILDRYRIALPPKSRAMLEAGGVPPGQLPEHHDSRLIATAALALDSAAQAAARIGLSSLTLGDCIEAEARELGRVMAGIGQSAARLGQPAARPALLLSGGEAGVTLGEGAAGRGGRNGEYLLSLALALRGEAGIWALAADSDGIDGNGDAAGGIVSPDTLERARAMGLDPSALLAAHDSHALFDRLGDLVTTGPTLTNVNDIRMMLIL